MTSLPDIRPTAPIAGPVFRPGDPEYAAEVGGFNLAHQPTPAVVVAATSALDVSAAVRWAGELGIPASAQATGHGLTSSLDGGVMVSTRRLQTVEIDPAARTARVGAGVRWLAVVDAAAAHGLAPLSGSSSGVGAVGYTLGGGMGLLARQYGFAADHVRCLTVVTGDGTIAIVDAENHADLFWALRGGRSGFGIVTEMEIDLVPVSHLYAGSLFFDGGDARAVLGAWATWVDDLPESVTTSVALLRLPPDPMLPPPLQGRFVVSVRFACTDRAEGERLLAPMREVAPIVFDTVVPELPYAAADAVHMDPPTPLPCVDSGLTLRALTPQAVDALLATAGDGSGSVLVLVEVRLMGGALARPAAEPNAVPSRDAAFGVYALGIPAGPAAALAAPQVARVVGALAEWRAGALPNFLGHAEPGDWGRMWPAGTRATLLEIARRYDPSDVFGGAALLA